MKDVFLTKIEAAQLVRISVRSLENWMRQGRIPYLKIGRTVRFPRDLLMRDLEKYGVNFTAEEGA